MPRPAPPTAAGPFIPRRSETCEESRDAPDRNRIVGYPSISLERSSGDGSPTPDPVPPPRLDASRRRWMNMGACPPSPRRPPSIPTSIGRGQATRCTWPNWSTDTTDGFDGDKSDVEKVLKGLNVHLADLQQMLYAEAKHKVLVVLRGWTPGQGRHHRARLPRREPVGVKVPRSSRQPRIELAHDYLWRVHGTRRATAGW